VGSDNLFHKRNAERQKRKENIEKQRSSNWLVICEGKQTEPNYFSKAVYEINKKILDDKYKLKVKIVGKGMNTVSLVKATDLQVEIDRHRSESLIPYGKIFVVFDKDSFSDKEFNDAVEMCEANGYIPLWSNQAVEYWFLLHFNYVNHRMNRTEYFSKINDCFKRKGLIYKYHKNDKDIYYKLCQYGSLELARTNAKKIHLEHLNDRHKPSNSESCTTIYRFFDEIDERLNELK